MSRNDRITRIYNRISVAFDYYRALLKRKRLINGIMASISTLLSTYVLHMGNV